MAAALAMGTRKKRMTITSDAAPATVQPVADALRSVAGFVQEYAR